MSGCEPFEIRLDGQLDYMKERERGREKEK
jgi:hypothetical protein